MATPDETCNDYTEPPVLNAPITVIGVNTYTDGDIIVIEQTQVRYTMRGWNASSGQFEYWSSTDPLAPNPSGNTLIDKTIVSKVQQVT